MCKKIDNYVRDRIIIADEVIQESAAEKISDGDVILTYARCVHSDHIRLIEIIVNADLRS